MFTIEDPYIYFEKPDVLLHLAWRDGFVHYSENHIADLPKHYHFLKKMVDSGIRNLRRMEVVHELHKIQARIRWIISEKYTTFWLPNGFRHSTAGFAGVFAA